MLNKLPILFLFVAFHSVSDIHVGAYASTDFTHPDGSGIYFDLLRKVYQEEPLVIDVTSFARAKSNFSNKDSDIVLGVYSDDIQDKLLPAWPLDQEYPVVAFYDSRKVVLDHISDIEKISTSWVRGYDFEKFIPQTKSNYDISHPTTGFKLLLNGRIEALIDYPYNQPRDLPDYIKTFQLMPSRKIYAAFQSNLRGKKLAQKFDDGMEKLMNSGELEQIFGEYYETSGFGENVHKNIIVDIYTDERELLDNKTLYIDTTHSSLYQIATLLDEQLTGYSFNYQELSDVDQALTGNKKSFTCALNAVQNPVRVENYTFSRPISLYQGLRLYSTRELQTSDTVDLSETLNKNSTLRLGVHPGRSYGDLLDKKIKTLPSEQVINASINKASSIKRLNNDRFDLLIESPISFFRHWPQITKDKEIYSYKLASSNPYITGHIACAKSAESGTFINKVNLALDTLYQTGPFYKAQKDLSKYYGHQKFVRAYIQNFN